MEDLLQKFNMASQEAHALKMKVESESSSDSDDKPDPPRPRVSISETSTLHVFENQRDDMYRFNIAYTAEDRDFFIAKALQDADRITNLITTAPQHSRAESIKYLVTNKIVTREELIGIEHLTLDKSPSRAEIRKRHSDAVLKVQDEYRQQWLLLLQQRQQPPLQDVAIALGKFARRNSHESRKRAKARAGLCCDSRRRSSPAKKATGC